MKTYITIDGGTTNTRVTLVKNDGTRDTVKLSIGAKKSMDGSGELKAAIRDAITALLLKNSLSPSDVCRILASGMITSEYGLCALPHVEAPAGIPELHAAIHETVIPDVSEIPFVFVRGVKVVGASVYDTDMMRGEESELYGITDGTEGHSLYVLPGSHSKLIETDREGRISHFSTMLTGEMLAAIATDTILRDAVDLSVSEFDEKKLLEGAEYALTRGYSEALFKVRVLKNFFDGSPVEVYSFFLGAILSSEIKAIAESDAPRVVIGGRKQLKEATALLLSHYSDKEIVPLSEETVDASSSRGVIRIYEYGA